MSDEQQRAHDAAATRERTQYPSPAERIAALETEQAAMRETVQRLTKACGDMMQLIERLTTVVEGIVK